MSSGREICFVFIGGTHQIHHLAPVAAALSRRDYGILVRCICVGAEAEATLRSIAARMAADRMEIVRMPLPLLARLAMRITGRKAAAKGPVLAAIRLRARRADAIVVPERTSAALRRMGWRRPLIHFRHGAGDRAPASEARLKAFDLIVVPGEKDIARAVSQGIPPARLRIGGYVKLDYLRSAPSAGERLFADDRPVVMYNPHFDAAISSLGVAREVIARFRGQDRYNLVFAPHVRGVEDMPPAERDDLLSQAVPGRIIIDLGSPSLFDMRYAEAADIYLGDMSSQLYEFLSRPRPVAFLDAHGVDWRGDPRYAGWHLGEVADGPGAVLQAVDRAVADHSRKVDAQRRAVIRAFGDDDDAIERSVDILLDAVGSPDRARGRPL